MKKDAITTYEQMGIAAMIPGMVHMLELMQAALDEMRVRLAAAQNGRQPAKESVSRSMKQKLSKVGNMGWPADPEERRLEGQRRAAVRKANQEADRRSAAVKQRWAKMPKAQRATHIAQMNRARLAKRKSTVKLAVAS